MKSERWILLLSGAGLAILCLSMALPGALAWQTGDTYTSGDWDVNNPTEIGDETLYIDGDITVDSTLYIYSSDILMTPGYDGEYSIDVTSNGALYIYGSVITSKTGAHYNFLCNGPVQINQSDISHVWGDTGSWKGGIRLQADGSRIANSSIHDGLTGGIYIYGCSAEIYSNDIYSNGYSGSSSYCFGIYVHDSGSNQVNITYNSIYDNTYSSWPQYFGTGIRSEGQNGSDFIANNTISRNGFGGYDDYGRQLDLYQSGPAIWDNTLTYGQYGIYADSSYPPTVSGGTITSYAYYYGYYDTTNGIYLTNSGFPVDGVTFKIDYLSGDLYGIYMDSASWLTVGNCTFDQSYSGSYYSKYGIYAPNGGTVNVTLTTFLNDYDYSYPVHVQNKVTLKIDNCTFNNNYGYYYGVRGEYGSKVFINDSTFSSYGAYYYYGVYVYDRTNLRIYNTSFTVDQCNGDIYVMQAQSSSPITLSHVTVDISNWYYGWNFYVVQAYSNSHVTADNLTVNYNNLQGYYMYTFYLDSCDLTLNDSYADHANDYTYYYTYFAQVYYGSVYMNNVTYNCVRLGGYEYYGTYFVYAPDWSWGNNPTRKGTYINCNVTIDSPTYVYGIYHYLGQGSLTVFIDNCTFDLRCGGYGFYGLELEYADVTLRNTVITMDYYYYNPYGWGELVYIDGNWNTRNTADIDNCTFFLETESPSPNTDSWYLLYVYNMDVYVDRCNLTIINRGGFEGATLAYIDEGSNVLFNDTEMYAYYGGGSGSGGEVYVFECYYMAKLNLTRTSINITTDSEPIMLDTFYIYGPCGEINIVDSTILWTVNSGDSRIAMVTMSTNSWDPGQLDSMMLKNSRLTMVVNQANVQLGLLKITPKTSIDSFSVSNAVINLTLLVPSATPMNAIDLRGVDSFALTGLQLELNAPVSSDTRIIGLRLESASPDLDNVTIKGNGEGRITGVWATLASNPTLNNTRISGVHTGLYSSYFSMPYLTGTSISSCVNGLISDNIGNATLVGCNISGAEKAVAVTEDSWVTLTDTVLQATTSDLDLNGNSTAWLLNTTFNSAGVVFGDDLSTLIVNWWLQLRITWQNDRVIPGADATIKNARAVAVLSATTDEKGIIPWFTVVEYVQTNLAKTSYSPYNVRVGRNGFSGEASVTTDRSKEETVRIVDNANPILTVLEPLPGRIQNTTGVTFRGTASDIGSGIYSVSYSHDGTGWKTIDASPFWEFDTDIPEGAWAFTVKLSDIAGNEVSVTINITIDLTRPFIEVYEPADNSLGNSIGVTIVGRVEPGAVFTVNLRPVNVSADGTFSYQLRLVEGRNVFSLFARDRAGNTNSTDWTLVLDITPPLLVLTSPEDGRLTNDGTVTVSGHTEPGAVVSINGVNATVAADGNFSVQYILTEGTNIIRVVATDAVGNNRTLLRNVVLDTQLSFTLTEPADRTVTNRITLLIRGRTDIDSALRLNDGLVTVGSDGNFTVTFTLEEGLNTLIFVAADRAGNIVRITRVVTLDTVLPALELTSPVPGAAIRVRDIVVNGTCEAGVNLTVNGNTASTDGGVFSVPVVLAEGASVITVTATDAAGNQVTITVNVLVDTSPPALEIVEPLDGFRTLDASVLVVGLTEPGATVTVNGVTVVVDQFGKFSTTVTIRKGSNAIAVTATDAAGNQNARGITVKMVSSPAPLAESNWVWSVGGLLMALGIILPLTMLLVNELIKRKSSERRD